MSVSISILGIDRICESQCGLFKEALLYLPFTFVGIGKFFAGVYYLNEPEHNNKRCKR